MERITYADAWNFSERRPDPTITASEARARHDSGERYTALLGDGTYTEKSITLELGLGRITVNFFDVRQRVGMTRVYGQREGDRIFLESTAFYNYSDEDVRGERAVHWEATAFGKDGSWRCTEHHADGSDDSAGYLIDVAEHWEMVPAFGEYASISRYV